MMFDKIKKNIKKTLLMTSLAGLFYTGTFTDLPFGIRAFKGLENKTFVGLNVGFENKINCSKTYGLNVGYINNLMEGSKTYGLNLGFGNSLINDSKAYGLNLGLINGLDNNSKVYGVSLLTNVNLLSPNYEGEGENIQ